MIVFTLWYELQMDITSSFDDFNDQMHKLQPVFWPKANSFTSVLVSVVLNRVEQSDNVKCICFKVTGNVVTGPQEVLLCVDFIKCGTENVSSGSGRNVSCL